jgi:hypothetical protein
LARNSEIIEFTIDQGVTDLWMKSNQTGRRFSLRAIWSRKLQYLGTAAFLTVVIWLCSYDANLFGPESREIAGGYRLKRANNPNQFAMTIPYEDGGLIIDEIGWREPRSSPERSAHNIGTLSIQRALNTFASVTCSENQIRFLNLFK